ncbi:MAG: hypothetical protein NXI31_15690 [bacterium]|nr:hypothetical protein [bacterium]
MQRLEPPNPWLGSAAFLAIAGTGLAVVLLGSYLLSLVFGVIALAALLLGSPRQVLSAVGWTAGFLAGWGLWQAVRSLIRFDSLQERDLVIEAGGQVPDVTGLQIVCIAQCVWLAICGWQLVRGRSGWSWCLLGLQLAAPLIPIGYISWNVWMGAGDGATLLYAMTPLVGPSLGLQLLSLFVLWGPAIALFTHGRLSASRSAVGDGS